jgi:hypothetical protein
MTAVAQLAIDGEDWNQGNDAEASLRYRVFYDPAVDNESDVEAAVGAVAPDVYRGLVASRVHYRVETWGLIEARVKYGKRPKPNPDGPRNDSTGEFAFEIATQQVRVIASLAVISAGNASGKTIPDNGNLIGVDPKDGKPEGIDVPQATYSFSEVHHFRNADVTTGYKVALAGLVGTVNYGAGFRGFAAGEVLCTGVSGSKTGDDDWKLRFAWTVLPNVASLTVGSITGINKAGWDYLEWFYEEKENTTNKRIERELTGYRVHRVLRTGDYSAFDIGS